MIRLAAAALMLLAASAQGSAPSPDTLPAQVPETLIGQAPEAMIAQVIVRQQVIVRVPRAPARVEASAAPVQWRETAGPRCISIRQIAAAMPSAASVDILMQDRRRIRARLGQRCAGLEHYRGIYFNANPDGRICAERDVIRSRMGGQCEIVQFRTLQPVPP